MVGIDGEAGDADDLLVRPDFAECHPPGKRLAVDDFQGTKLRPRRRAKNSGKRSHKVRMGRLAYGGACKHNFTSGLS